MNHTVVLGAIALCLSFGHRLLAQGARPTPNESDIPQAVAGESSLAGSERPDISRFLNIRTAKAPSLSPDRKLLAFQTAISGSQQLWIVEAGGGRPRQLTYGEPVSFHEWSPSGDWIVYGVDRGGNERQGFYLINRDGTVERELLSPSDAFRKFGEFTRDGKKLAYATTERNGRDFDIYLLDIESGQNREVFRGRMGLYATSWRPDSGAVILTETRGEDARNVYLLDVSSGKVEDLFKPDVASFYGSFSWAADGKGFYLVTNQEREFNALAYYDIGRARLNCIETPEHDVEYVALSSNGDFLAWVTNEGGYSKLRVRNLVTGQDLPPPDLPRGIYQLKWAAGEPVIAIWVSGPQVPGDIWTWVPASGELRRATHSDSGGLDLSAMVVPEHLSFAARDGTIIHGLLYRPACLPLGQAAPVLLAVHGGPTAQARPDFERTHQYLLSRGIAVFDLNYRGSTGYGKRFARLNDRRLRENELNDLADAIDWLGRQKRIDGTRVGIMGASYGGYLTMASVARLPNRFKSGVAFVGVADWLTALAGASPDLKASDRLEYGDIDDASDREFFRHLSPLTHIDNVRAPVMLIHGANDPRDPVTESDQFVRALRERGREVEYLRFPDEGHDVRKLSNQIIAYRRIALFLEKTLQVQPAHGKPEHR